MDTATVLEHYVSDLNNLPGEIAHILEEIRDRDLKFYETRKRIQQRDNQIHKFIRANGSLTENPKEAPAYPKIRADFEKATALQQEKCDLSNTGLYILAKHLKRLKDEIKKLQSDGLLAQSSEAPSVEPPSRQQTATPILKGRASLVSQTLKKRASPVPTSRGSTPAHSARASTPVSSLRENNAGTTPQIKGNVSTIMTEAPTAVSTPGQRPSKRQKLTDSVSVTPASGAAELISLPANHTQTKPQAHKSTGDEDEVLYCFCQQISFGNMVACDNPDCQYEWFHYDCVGLEEPPHGTWYCPACSKEKKDGKEVRKKKS